MDRPSELIRRARISGRQRIARIPKAETKETASPTPAPTLRHGVYSQLMRSHDRLRTRHLD